MTRHSTSSIPQAVIERPRIALRQRTGMASWPLMAVDSW